MSAPKWRITGEYYESCPCIPGCPCIFNSPPTKGWCIFLYAFYIKDGRCENVPFKGLKVAGMIHSPGNMWEGNYTQALYVDVTATQEQRTALETIFRGAAGGGAFAVLFGELVSTYLGTKYVPIVFDSEARKVSIPGILQMELEYIKGLTGKVPKIVDADFIPEQKVGRAVSSWFTDHAMNVDNTGGHAFISEFDLSGP